MFFRLVQKKSGLTESFCLSFLPSLLIFYFMATTGTGYRKNKACRQRAHCLHGRHSKCVLYLLQILSVEDTAFIHTGLG